MRETFFEMLERTRAVDRLLFWLAVLSPMLIAGAAALLRERPAVVRHRHRWVLACLAGPGLLILWKIYNIIVDHFGLDSIVGLFANVGIFAAAAMLATGLRLVLRTALRPSSSKSTSAPQAQTLPEFRPYKPAFGEPENQPGYSVRISESPDNTEEKQNDREDVEGT